MEDKIREYFSVHKLNPTGIRNFVCYTKGVREWIETKIEENPEYESVGGYIMCLLKNIQLPKCKKCGNTISYRRYKEKRPYCSKKCYKSDIKNVLEKAKKTNLKRYGVENCSSFKEFIEKRKETMIERYGVENITQNKKYVNKVRKTMLERYGVDYYTKTEESKRLWYKKSWENMVLKWSEYIIPLFKFEDYKGYKRGEEYNWKCVKCGNEFVSKITHNSSDESFGRMPRCFNCFPIVKKTSKPEMEIKEFIKSIYTGSIICNSNNIIPPLEIDIYIPEKRIAIEFNGLFYHNDKSKKYKKYHCVKSTRCENKNIMLIHIFEDEWKKREKL